MMGQKSFARIATLSVVSIAAAIVASTGQKLTTSRWATSIKWGNIRGSSLKSPRSKGRSRKAWREPHDSGCSV